jgi:hypothetical protein
MSVPISVRGSTNHQFERGQVFEVLIEEGGGKHSILDSTSYLIAYQFKSNRNSGVYQNKMIGEDRPVFAELLHCVHVLIAPEHRA